LRIRKLPNEKVLNWSVYSIEGKEVLSGNWNMNQNQIDVSSLKSGFYFVEFRDSKASYQQKFIKN